MRAAIGKAKRPTKPVPFKGAPKLFDDDKGSSNPSLKNRIRSLNRLLKKALPLQAVKDKTRMLKKLEQQVRGMTNGTAAASGVLSGPHMRSGGGG